MVFQTADAKVAVVGVYIDVDTGVAPAAPAARRRDRVAARSLVPPVVMSAGITVGAPTTSVLLETLLSSVEEIATPGTKVTSKPLVFSELVDTLKLGSFQVYTGSLTTPPCTEGVSWNVATQKLKISAATFEKIRNVVKFNSRFPQAPLGQPNVLSNAVLAPAAVAPTAA